MKKNKTIQFKAALLLFVFSLNTLLGFACSLGLKMGYNQEHHPAGITAPSLHTEHHEHDSEPKHHEDKKQHHTDSESSKDDDCCSNGVTSFNLINKTVPQLVQFVHPVFFIAFTATWFNSGILPYLSITKNIKPFVRSHHPPIPDIRIAIQSFQI